MNIFASEKKTLVLGRQGEKMVTTISFPVARWISEYGPGTFALFHQRKGTLNNVLAAPSIMPTLTDAEKAAARERIGLNDRLVLIETVDLGGVNKLYRNAEPDGTAYNFRDFAIRCCLRAGRGPPNLTINGSTVTFFPTSTTVDRYAATRCFIYNGSMVSISANGVSGWNYQSNLYCTPSGVFDVNSSGNINRFELSATAPFTENSLLEIWGESMKKNILVKVGERIVTNTIVVDDYNEVGEIIGQHEEEISRTVDIMEARVVDMTPEEEAEVALIETNREPTLEEQVADLTDLVMILTEVISQ